MASLFAVQAGAASITHSLGYQDAGYVQGGGTLAYDHVFAPTDVAAGEDVVVDKITLSLVLSEDMYGSLGGWFRDPQWATFEIEGDALLGDASTSIVWGDLVLTAEVTAFDGGGVGVTLASPDDDFSVVISRATFEYTTVASTVTVQAIPEPTAALAFCAGALVLSRGLRRRS